MYVRTYVYIHINKMLYRFYCTVVAYLEKGIWDKCTPSIHLNITQLMLHIPSFKVRISCRSTKLRNTHVTQQEKAYKTHWIIYYTM